MPNKKSKKNSKRDIVENKLIEELDEIKKNEVQIQQKEASLEKKLDDDLNKDEIERKRVYYGIKHFSFNEFAQIVIGCCVFGLPAYFTPDIWNFISNLNVRFLSVLHVFFILCILIALNFEFRDNFGFDGWFYKMLFKRLFYQYVSVLIIVVLILVLVGKMNYNLANIDVFRNYLAADSVGLFGATTYSFLKK